MFPKLLVRVAGAGGGIGEREEEKERPAARAPIGSILRSLAAAKLGLVNQIIGGVGRHSGLLFGDRHGHVIERFSRF